MEEKKVHGFRNKWKRMGETWKGKLGIPEEEALSLLTIRSKLILGFLLPVLFMILIGVVSYYKAREGMGEKFADSTVQTIQMVKMNLDSSCDFVKAAGLSLVMDDELKKVFLGLYGSDPSEESKKLSEFRKELLGNQASNSFISNMHIIPKEDYRIVSTGTTIIIKGGLEEYRKDVMAVTGTFDNWVDWHRALDQKIGMKSSDYIMAYQVMTNNDLSAVVVDISSDAILELLNVLDLGEKSVVGFVTAGGRELIYSQDAEIYADGFETVFYGQEFFREAKTAREETGVFEKVRFLDEDYMFFYSRSNVTGAMVCALVPVNFVMSQTNEIRLVAIVVVIIAILVVAGIALLIITGIQKNMKRLSAGFSEVAEGDLTVEVKVSGRDEFYGLADSANHMVRNTKQLVGKVSEATMHLERSAQNVKGVSETVTNYSGDISHVLAGINSDMENQAVHARECVERANTLSHEIQEMNRLVNEIEGGIHETEQLIGNAVTKVQVLGEHAKQTTDITMEVGQSIEKLKAETTVINQFVSIITDISSQTNLLSLNASIEAARAGEAGMGFAVVATEIRQLADDSTKAAGEIKSNVEHIVGKAQDSVERAGKAQAMVLSQTEIVEQVIEIFKEMSRHMLDLTTSVKEVMEHTGRTDAERERTLHAVENISDIIADTAKNASAVSESLSRLMTSVENLNGVSRILDENMKGLKMEIASFKTE